MKESYILNRLSKFAVFFAALLIIFPLERCFAQGYWEVEVLSGFEGANPQTQDGIVPIGERMFRITPVLGEKESYSYYYRFLTKVVNHALTPKDIELIIYWPELGERGYMNPYYYYGDIGNWHWTYASIRDSEAKIHITVPPGTTYVGVLPGYSYSHLQNVLSELGKNNPYIDKRVEGKSQKGLNIWYAKITDKSVPSENKRNIFITARNHPYETSSSYVIEEIMKWLISDDSEARSARRKYEFHVIPMCNPDGVVDGWSQLTSSDGANTTNPVNSDDLASQTQMRILDRIKPELYLDFHSWMYEMIDGFLFFNEKVSNSIKQQLPDGTFQGYKWYPDRTVEKIRGEESKFMIYMRSKYNVKAGLCISIAWFRRSEQDVREIGPRFLEAALKAME